MGLILRIIGLPPIIYEFSIISILLGFIGRCQIGCNKNFESLINQWVVFRQLKILVISIKYKYYIPVTVTILTDEFISYFYCRGSP